MSEKPEDCDDRPLFRATPTKASALLQDAPDNFFSTYHVGKVKI